MLCHKDLFWGCYYLSYTYVNYITKIVLNADDILTMTEGKSDYDYCNDHSPDSPDS